MFNRRRLIRFAFLYFLLFFIVCFWYLIKLESAPPPSTHRLAVIVPYRNRSDELKEFIPHMHAFLTSQSLDYRFFIINQIDKHRFNRAALINIGFLESQSWADYLVMHDVDLLPLNLKQLSYRYPTNGPVHLASPEYHPLYHYPKYVGGILMVTSDDFRRINGMCPLYWGWGTEDDNFYLRMKLAGMKIYRPHNLSTNRSNTFRHVHNKSVHKRDYAKYGNQSERRKKATTGNRLEYNEVSTGQSRDEIDRRWNSVSNVQCEY